MLSFSQENGKLAMQIGRAYGSNRHSETPVHLYLTGLGTVGSLTSELKKKITGFGTASCIVSKEIQGLTEVL